MRTVGWSVMLLGMLVGGVSSTADEIKLKDGTKFSGTILNRDASGVIVQLPRTAVESVNNQALPPPVAEGTEAPAFTAVDIQGTTQKFSKDEREPTLLAFWATWCPHCRSDVTLLKAFSTKYRSNELRILAVSVDRDPAAVKKFANDQGVTYTVIAAAAQAKTSPESIPDLYEVQGIPAYYLIDSHGVIRKAKSGSIVEGQAQSEWEGMIKGLLPTKP